MDENVVIYSYYFNINFGFEDNQAFHMKVDGINAIIYFEKVSHTAYHPYQGNDTNWKIQNGMSFDPSLPNSSGGQDVIGHYFIESEDIFSTGYTRNGIANIIHIRFDSQMPPRDRQAFVEKCLNRFLDIYRFMTFHGYGDNYLNNKAPLFKVQEGVLRNQTQFRQDSLNHGVFFTMPPEDALESFTQRVDIVERIAGRLMQDKSLKTYERLLNTGKKLYVYEEDFPLAIVMFGSAFETYIQSKIMELCEIQGVTQLPVKGKNPKPYLEVIEKANIGILLEKHLCELASIQNIRTQQVCIEWDKNLYKKRNRIIHRGHTDFSKNDVEKAYFAVINFIEFIHKLPVRN